MKNYIYTILTAAIALTFNACRDTADDVISYGQNDYLNFAAAEESYEAQFKALWTALNCNYAIWDYEEEQGLDWDAVYKQYKSKMASFDSRLERNKEVSDDEFQRIYESILNKLHDGHIYIQIKNLYTGNYLDFSPSDTRNSDRNDYYYVRLPQMSYYLSNQAGENEIVEYDTVTTRPAGFMKNEIANALSQIDKQISKLEHKNSRTDLDDYFLNNYKAAKQELERFNPNSYSAADYYNNELRDICKKLDIDLNVYDIESSDYLDVRLALFRDGIVYFQLSDFGLYPFINGIVGGSYCSDSLSNRVFDVIDNWVNTVQELHYNRQLKGVIIDVRNNGGGYSDDYQYVLGSLLREGGHKFGYHRIKTGIGRYDYSPLTPDVMPTLDAGQEAISEPIVVLANCNSVSMSEQTCLGAKDLSNARVIGTPTWGAYSPLYDDPIYYSLTYASVVGIQDETPFYAYIPCSAYFNSDKEICEGVGVTPDIKIDLDEKLLRRNGRDNQLERALQYIRTGK
ncbi:MAG: hypothetical protein IKR17_01900 [Bacteroidales bacterium]|nr:hypothetical protein [Bacteroidales bacterium]